jgi:catechol 2,3-dioxygenase-like lactoylglutathione lyase family enzyme
MTKSINGIQQMGVGVENIGEAFKWFRQNFSMNIVVFDEKAIAEIMLPHTEGKTRERHAILALNMQAGGGFEIWQHTGRKPLTPTFDIQLGDLGICITKMKTADAVKAHAFFKSKGLQLLTDVTNNPAGIPHFYLKDVFGNTWEFVQDPYLFKKNNDANGGVFGAVIGVKNMEESLPVYADILGYDKVVYDRQGTFDDWKGVNGSGSTFRRMLLQPSAKRNGAFSPLFGPSQIELVQALDREPADIFAGRMWGDPGFIHLCFDINGMDELREEVKAKGFPFTVDSAHRGDTFDMGEAAGSFAYIQAPEGTLIEFVETHKVPMMKKWGWYLDLRKRGEAKPLPRWILNLFSLKKVKD